MSTRPSEIVRDLMGSDPHGLDAVKAVTNLADELDDGSHDRAVAIRAAAYFEDCLKSAIRRHFVDDLTVVNLRDLFEAPYAPLYSLPQRISMASALGILNAEQSHDASWVELVRHAFAHTVGDVSFESRDAKMGISRFLAFKDRGELSVFGETAVSAMSKRLLFVLVVANLCARLSTHAPPTQPQVGVSPKLH